MLWTEIGEEQKEGNLEKWGRERKMERDVEDVRREQKLREKNRTIDDVEKKKRIFKGELEGERQKSWKRGRDGSRGMRKKNQ